jgi:drug/metabolite transporter (DMT)-like permease
LDKKPLLYVILSATLFGLSAPLAKLLLEDISPIAMAGLLYMGAFIGLAMYSLDRKIRTTGNRRTVPLEKRDFPWLIGAIVAGGIVAPISLMFGLQMISGFATSLFLNLEGIATVIIAIFFFHENVGKRLWLALICVTVAGMLLSWNTEQNQINIAGPLLVILACIGWGVDNNLTRHIAEKDSVQIAMIKGLVAGAVSLSVAFILGRGFSIGINILLALILGAFSYGLSLVFFIQGLKGLGASRTGVFYSFGPFIGAIASIIILKEWLGWVMLPAIALMILGVWLITTERHVHRHHHESVIHSHSHRHDELHHDHEHPEPVQGSHVHVHTHIALSHTHAHWPDTHHRHAHSLKDEANWTYLWIMKKI